MTDVCNVRGLPIAGLGLARCQLPKGHAGPHRVVRYDEYGRALLEWDEEALAKLREKAGE